CNRVPGQGAITRKRHKGCYSDEQRRLCFHMRERVWSGCQCLDWRHHVFLISAVITDTADFLVLAMPEITSPALAASVVVTAMPAHAHALSFFPRGNAGPDFINDAGHFVPGDARVLYSRHHAFFREHVAVANATSLNFDAYLPCAGLRNLTLHDFKGGAGFADLRRLHWRCD